MPYPLFSLLLALAWQVLARNELQFLALLPALRPNVKVVVEMGPS